MSNTENKDLALESLDELNEDARKSMAPLIHALLYIGDAIVHKTDVSNIRGE